MANLTQPAEKPAKESMLADCIKRIANLEDDVKKIVEILSQHFGGDFKTHHQNICKRG